MLLRPIQTGGSVLSQLVSELGARFGGHAAVVCPVSDGRSWSLEFADESGPDTSLQLCARFQTYLSGAPATWTLWDPVHVGRADQNVAKIIDNRRFQGVDVVRHFYRPCGIDTLAHLTLISSHGPRLLGWTGVWRERRFTKAEEIALSGLARSIADRLALLRSLGTAAVNWAIIEAAVAALRRPAFIISRGGRIELANEAGARLLQRDSSAAQDLATGLKEQSQWSVTTINATGTPPMELVVQRLAAFKLDELTAAATDRWHLTRGQVKVLKLVANGLSNKEIAALLVRSERTIELHVSALLRHAGLDSRSKLIALLWSEVWQDC